MSKITLSEEEVKVAIKNYLKQEYNIPWTGVNSIVNGYDAGSNLDVIVVYDKEEK